MPLYTKFLKDLLTKKGKYTNNESIVVEDNCSDLEEATTHVQRSRKRDHPMLHWGCVHREDSH